MRFSFFPFQPFIHSPAKQSKASRDKVGKTPENHCGGAESSSPEDPSRAPSMVDQEVTAAAAELGPPSAWPPWTSLLLRAMSKRRTWVALFLAVYAGLLFSSWSLLASVRAWYYAAAAAPAWPAALYASVMYGAVFGLLSMAAALAVAAPAMLVTWTTVLVLLAFAGKPRRSLVAEGRRATADIARLALRVLLREGNAVAALCAVASFAVLLLGRRDDDDDLAERKLI